MALGVSGNGQDYAAVPGGFVYDAAPVVAAVVPALGAATGGTVVSVTGAGLGAVTACFFGEASTPATVLSAGEVQCATPPNAAGALAVGASVNGVDATFGAARFRYVPAPEVLAVEPAAVEAGATVVVRGLHFPDATSRTGPKSTRPVARECSSDASRGLVAAASDFRAGR